MIGTTLAALGTLAILSYAFADNPAYRLAETLLIGTTCGHSFVMGVINVQRLALTPLLGGQVLMIIPIVLGVLLLTRAIPKLAWLSVYPIAVIVGLGVGTTLRGAIFAQFIAQVKATILPLNSIDNIIIVVGTIAVLSFFYFTKERKGALGVSTNIGRWIMMVAFGATFGDSVMMAMTLLIGRLQFIYQTWLHLF